MDARTQSAAQAGERAKIEYVITRAHKTAEGTGAPLPRDGGRNDVATSRVGRERRQDDSTWPHQETSSGIPIETKHRMMMSRDPIRPVHGAMTMSNGPAGDGARPRQGNWIVRCHSGGPIQVHVVVALEDKQVHAAVCQPCGQPP